MKYNQPITTVVCLGAAQKVMLIFEAVSSTDSVIGGYQPGGVDPGSGD